ncbi:MAG TPA: hypothetical protein V6C99_02820 [Oculatellaceae cyanobacterium]|jgi:cytidine deaminase
MNRIQSTFSVTALPYAAIAPAGAQLSSLGQAQVRHVSFSGQQDALERKDFDYQLKGCSRKESKNALPELLKAQSFAQATERALKTADNKRFFGAVLEFEDGQKFLSGSYILLRDRPRCDLDNAITLGMRQWQAQNWNAEKPLQLPRVKALYLANANLHSLANPCEDCLALLNTSIFTPETQIYTLEGTPTRPNSVIRKQTVADILPLHQGRANDNIQWLTSLPVKELAIQTSTSAQQALAKMERPVSSTQIRRMVTLAKRSYEQSQKTDPLTQTHAGSAVLVNHAKRRLYAGSRFEWARRWPEFADLDAAKKGLQKAQQHQWRYQKLLEQPWIPPFLKERLANRLERPSITAVSYYNDMPPSIRSLGRLRRHRGSDDTLVITVENNTIQVRTIQDYLPAAHNTPLIIKRNSLSTTG